MSKGRHRPARSYWGYHLLVAVVLGGVLFAGCEKNHEQRFTEQVTAADIVPDIFTRAEAHKIANRQCQDYMEGMTVGDVIRDLLNFSPLTGQQASEFVAASIAHVCTPAQQAAARDNHLTP
jgi:hypothetical protein